MAKSRRLLSFSPPAEENKCKPGKSICELCLASKPHTQLSAPASWKVANAQQIAVTYLALTRQSLICRLCRDDISRMIKNPEHVPRWAKEGQKGSCCIPLCGSTALVKSKIATPAETAQILNINLQKEESIPYPTPLCKKHYHKVYDALQSKQTHCCTCGTSLRGAPIRVCPNATQIQMYLSEKTGFEGTITEGDRVCTTCYKSHLQILRDVQYSTDSDLQAVIDTLKGSVSSGDHLHSTDDVINRAMYITAIFVGERLLHQESLLLPFVHERFISCASEISLTAKLELQKEDIQKVTTRWILSNLIVLLKHHLSYACRVRKIGTLLYRTNGDLLTSLTLSLHKGACVKSSANGKTGEESQDFSNAFARINSCIHNEIRKHLSADLKNTYSYDCLDVDRLVSETDPELWNFISLITRSISERKGYYNPKTNDPTTLAHHIKKGRRLFCLCVLMFCTDDRCSIPVHTLVTDMIESYGGSTQLVKMLNRLGVCSSADTLARSIQYRVREREKKGPELDCAPNPTTIISTDNLDFLHSYAQVFCGNQTSSWHGTTVQAVQPKPCTFPDLLGSAPIQTSVLSSPMHVEEEMQQHTCTCTGRSTCTYGETTALSLTCGPSHPRHSECITSHPSLSLAGRKRAAAMRSPHSSPSKSCRSPIPKVRRRARTGLEGNTTADSNSPTHHRSLQTNRPPPNVQRSTVGIESFRLSKTEEKAFEELREELDTFITQKCMYIHTNPESTEVAFLNIQDYMRLVRPVKFEKSNVVYLQVLDALSESKDTLMQILFDLHLQFIERQGKGHVVLTADAKLYEVIQSLKYEYGDELKWLLPFLGDWHLLKNYQIALMKPYFDAGLKELAHTTGYPVAAIQNCSQFKRTHNFLVEVWQSLYQVMIERYIESTNETCTPSPHFEMLHRAMLQVHECENTTFANKLVGLKDTIQKSGYHSKFSSFLNTMASNDYNWKFWVQFVFKDAMAYIGLYLAIRSGNWKLRLASIKLMAAVYSAFDHQTYKNLISQHLVDVYSLPTEIRHFFNTGGFSVSLSGCSWHSVAIDEAHEMKINKECKTSIVRPSKDYISRVAGYIPYRAKCLENLREQLFPEERSASSSSLPCSILSKEARDRKASANIREEIKLINSVQHLPLKSTKCELVNPFTHKKATLQQEHDLLSFREVGQEEFEKHVLYYVLKQASVRPPQRKKRLLTFSERKATKRVVSQLERDQKIVQKCLHKKIKWSKQTGRPIDKIAEQFVPIPLALADSNGIPLKGQKSNTTKALKARYKDATPNIFLNELPRGWIPQCVMLEGMFMLNTTPLASHRTFADYANFLIQRYITPHFTRGSIEVHLLFDNPGRHAYTPKSFERRRHDMSANVGVNHVCDEFHTSYPIPKKWRESIINCRNCKRNLVYFLSKYILKAMPKHIQPGKVLYLAGCFEGNIEDTAWCITKTNTPQPEPLYTCNAEETDTRVWRHVKMTECVRILVMSPDTDVYHIGLPLIHRQKEIVIQINTYNCRDLCYLHLSALLTAFTNDPDLSSLSATFVPQIFQTIFVASGCDYISFFSGIGKATFLRYFFQYAEFITSGRNNTPGTLANVNLDNGSFESGFLAFLRLIGVVYMKKHGSGFTTTPPAYFNQFNAVKQPPQKHHEVWLHNIRQCIWDRVQFENEMIPNTESLFRHWKRVCWVLDMWRQADLHQMSLKSITEYGWNINNDTLTVDWDCEDNMKAVRERVEGLLKGCSYKTGCETRQCGCRKKGKECGEGCNCINCKNTKHTMKESDDLAAVSTEEVLSDVPPSENIEEIMEWVFGDYTLSSESEDGEESSDQDY